MKAAESVGKASIRMGSCNYAWLEMRMAEKPSFDAVFLKLFILHNLVVYRIKGIPVYSMEIVSSGNERDRIIGASVRGELDDHSIIELLKERFDTYIASQFHLGQKRLRNLLLVLRVSSHGVLDNEDMKGA